MSCRGGGGCCRHHWSSMGVVVVVVVVSLEGGFRPSSKVGLKSNPFF